MTTADAARRTDRRARQAAFQATGEQPYTIYYRDGELRINDWNKYVKVGDNLLVFPFLFFCW